MPDRRKHRGRHPADEELFGAATVPTLRTATSELSWLLERGYSVVSALKLVGDRHELRERQRTAVQRCACSESARESRVARQVAVTDLAGSALAIDGFNCLITIEAALAGGVVLVGRDGCHRDLASVHGSYRRVEETARALAAICDVLAPRGLQAVRWYLDRPVSNSGKLRGLILEQAEARGLDWEVELVDNPDRELAAQREHVVASCDSWVLDHCARWLDLQGVVIEAAGADTWLVNLGEA